MRRRDVRVLVCGGGVAGLEAMLALHELAGEFVDVELVAPEHHFFYRPLAVAEPVGGPPASAGSSPTWARVAGAQFAPGHLRRVNAFGTTRSSSPAAPARKSPSPEP